MQQILIIIGIIALFLFARWLRTQPTKKRWQWILIVVVTGLIALAMTGRLHWLVAAGAAVFTLLTKFFPILIRLFGAFRLTPLLMKAFRNSFFGKQKRTQFASKSLLLEIDPSTGTIDGTILVGQFKDKRLSSLSTEQLNTLRTELIRNDMFAVRLLQAYLYARNFTSEGKANESRGSPPPSDGPMTTEQACKILGLKPDYNEKDIITSHRRLIQKIHPDQGGSTYLSALINQARKCLLDKIKQ